MIVTLIVYPLICVALYYLGSRAEITRWLWSRYPRWLDRFTLCSACSGFWYGAAVAAGGGFAFELGFAGLPGDHWITPVIVGLCSIVWTPILAAVQVHALETLGGDDPQEA